jgi:hydrogenase nickel incorporation protein HypA/HybF
VDAVHELAVAESIVAAVTAKLADVAVRWVRVEVGALSGVVPDALAFCFELAVADTPLHGAGLEIVTAPGRGRCRECAAEFDTGDLLTLCRCGSMDIEVVGGRELLITAVEVA